MFILISVIIFLAYLISLIWTFIDILSRFDLMPSSRLAWFVVVLVFPFFGFIFYIFFGKSQLSPEIRRKNKIIWGKIREKIDQNFDQKDLGQDLIDPLYQNSFLSSKSINTLPILKNNKAELMKDAQTARKRLLDDLNNAKKYINLLYYIWLDDNTGTNIANALIQAQKRGVKCKIMVDALGSRKFTQSKIWQEMKEAGVETEIIFPLGNPLKVILFSRIDLRNHRKITIIDGNITYCGSQNCADEEFLVKAKYAPWIDIMLRVVGPVAASNQLLFASDWALSASNENALDEFDFSYPRFENGFLAQIWGTGPSERKKSSQQLFANLIYDARKNLTISTPYFIPDPTVLDALCAASYRGVDVKLIFPKRNDSWIVSAASRAYYEELLNAGIEIYEFVGGLLHSKTLTIDGQISLLGSSNLDLRSFDLNYENNILLQDQITTKAIETRQKDYMKSSDFVDVKEVQKRPLYRKIWNNLLATISPVL